MSNKITVPITDVVSDTLFIPLYMRHLETGRPDRMIDDPLASELVERIDYDFGKYTSFHKTQVGTSIRVRHFDRAVSRFVERNDNPVVISIGAGLDTRFQRIHTGKGVFYELDLPEVIEFRESLMPSGEGNPYIAKSMFELSWIDDIASKHPDAQFVIVAEGVFMYFDEDMLRPLITAIAEKFGPGELHFDACTGMGVRNSHRHETVKFTNARFKWAFDRDDGLTDWSPRLKYVSTEKFMTQEYGRWGFGARLASLIPAVRNMFRMLHYDIEGPSD